VAEKLQVYRRTVLRGPKLDRNIALVAFGPGAEVLIGNVDFCCMYR